MVEVVETYSKSREFEQVTIEESDFYYNAFFELVGLIEEATVEKICN